MNKLSTLAFSVVISGGVLGLYGCEKISEADISPQTSQPQPASQAKADKTLSKAHAAWLRFVEKVERKELKDLMGQYVSSDTWVEDKKDGARPTRPKFDAALANYPAWYGAQIKQEMNYTPGSPLSLVAIEEPIDDGGGYGGGSGPSIVYGNFESSENLLPASSYTQPDNPQGYIMDLKIATNDNFFNTHSFPPGYNYTRFTTNLNKGAGGTRIYLGFTRNPKNTPRNPEEPEYAYGAPRPPVTGIQVQMKESWYDRLPAQSTNYYNIWNARGYNDWNWWEAKDLNDGAGGWYIYAYQTKQGIPGPPTVTYRPIEVGILYGNSGSIQPPAGWTKDPNDLNKGAGGDYIYFCYKQR